MATDIASKNEMVKTRRSEIAAVDKKVDQLVRTWAPDEAPVQQGCFPKLASCIPWRSRASRVATSEMPAAVTSSTGEMRQSGQSNKLLMRMVGSKKQQTSETEKIQVAMSTVSSRVDSLSDRVKIGRERALRAKTEGRKEEAVRELKKSKVLEKQLLAARAALDTLERQQDMIAESALQRELATALQSTTAGVKGKNKGLLSLAESAIDGAVEVRDEVEDIAAVFEGMAPAYEAGVDDDELLAELDDLTQDTVGFAVEEPRRSPEAAETETAFADIFPSVPGTKPSRSQEKKALLKGEQSSSAVAGV